MANSITKRILLNGSRNYIVLWNVVWDGTAISASIVNAATGDMGIDNKVVRVIANMPVNCSLLFDATTDIQFMAIDANVSVDQDFRKIGGIVNNGGTGKTGDVLITAPAVTMSATAAGNAGGNPQSGYIVLFVQKK